MSTISATLVRGARPLGNTIPCGRCGIPCTRRPKRPHTLCADCRAITIRGQNTDTVSVAVRR